MNVSGYRSSLEYRPWLACRICVKVVSRVDINPTVRLKVGSCPFLSCASISKQVPSPTFAVFLDNRYVCVPMLLCLIQLRFRTRTECVHAKHTLRRPTVCSADVDVKYVSAF